MATTFNPRPRLSVALCTHNGAAHLREQWDSLLAQEWLPDEIIVSDDASSDGTVALVREWAKTAPFDDRVFYAQPRRERGLCQCRTGR